MNFLYTVTTLIERPDQRGRCCQRWSNVPINADVVVNAHADAITTNQYYYN